MVQPNPSTQKIHEAIHSNIHEMFSPYLGRKRTEAETAKDNSLQQLRQLGLRNSSSINKAVADLDVTTLNCILQNMNNSTHKTALEAVITAVQLIVDIDILVENCNKFPKPT